jgi:DMSO/TMAO reductase YedYZ heme-binding membrane subunit
MNSLLVKIRPIIYGASVLLALGLYVYAISSFETLDLQKIRLVQWYGFTALILLYLSLLASPLYHSFPNFPGRIFYVYARKAIGVSAFFFGLLHGGLAFFRTLGGFAGLPFFRGAFLLGIILGTTALVLLGLMAATSIHSINKKYNIPWKKIHRVVYAAGMLVLIHALMLGTHYIDLHGTVGVVTLGLVSLLILLQARRVDDYIEKTMPPWPGFGAVTLLAVLLLGIGGFRVYGHVSGNASLGIHTGHLGQQNQKDATKAPSYTGKRYSINVSPIQFTPNRQTPIQITIFDADTGTQVKEFSKIHDQLMHLVISDSSLSYFDHLHPTLENGIFSITKSFQADGLYRLYFQFMPKGESEQTVALTVSVGSNLSHVPSTQTIDSEKIKQAGALSVTMKPTAKEVFSIADLRSGKQAIRFRITSSADGTAVSDLQPYLGAFGHLVLIKQDSYEYVHVHPKPSLGNPNSGGPEVEFAPLAFANFQPLEPGIYRAFAQFKRQDSVFMVDYTLELKP